MKHEAPRLREAALHWRKAREGVLVIPYCGACSRFVWPVPAACPGCGGALEWRDCRGTGEVVTYSIVRRAVDPTLKEEVPYVVAIVELDEGVRLFTNVVDVDTRALRAGLRVKCCFEPTIDDDAWVPVFTAEG
jgi:uncharacterized OB-fold protein